MSEGPVTTQSGQRRVTVTVGALKEMAPGEARVALSPDSVKRLIAQGIEVLVEHAAGVAARFPDSQYVASGASVVTADELIARADAVLVVQAPQPALRGRFRQGQFLFGLLQARTEPGLLAELAAAGVVAVSLDLLPRTISGAQSMDALTSQANVAGYKSVLVAANAYGGYFPMLMTAAGTVRPARVLVLGAGVAGLQAIGTAHRLGAIVSGYDVRPATRGEIESLGATFLDVGVGDAEGAGGYARALSDEEQRAQQEALVRQIAAQDVVITTAQVPGHKPPVLVTEDALSAMRPGSVVVDLAASRFGGNVFSSVPNKTFTTSGGVTVIGAGNLPAQMPAAASTAYARNIGDLVTHFLRNGSLKVDPDDEIDAAVVVTNNEVTDNAVTTNAAAGPTTAHPGPVTKETV